MHEKALAAPHEAPDWVAWYLLFCLALLVFVKSVAFPRMVRIVQSTFSSQILQQLEREEVNLFRSYAMALNALFVLNVAFLAYKANETTGLIMADSTALSQFLFLLGAIIGLALFRLGANWLVAAITGSQKIVNEYVVSSTLVNQTFGLILFPCMVLLQFAGVLPSVFFWAAIILLSASVLLRWYRGLLMSAGEEGIGFVQILSYFCALEILPVLVLVKYVVESY